MEALKSFQVRRKDGDTWSYIVEIEDDGGSLMQLNATFEDLDEIATAIDEQLRAIVEAAEALGMSESSQS